MTVTSGPWWSAWWPWMIPWLAAAVTIPAAATVWIRHARGQARARRRADRVPHVPYYLNGDSVMDLYRQSEYKGALRREAEERIRSERDTGVSAVFHGIGGKGSRTVNHEVFRKWVEHAEPITVIGTVMGVLENADAVVHVNLARRHITANRALHESLGEAPDDHAAGHRPTSARLSQLGPYLLLTGQFRKAATGGGRTVFVAAYDDTNDAQRPRVRVTCTTAGLRARTTGRSFQARCLGVVEEWNAQEQELVLHPIAIFG